MDTQTTTVVKKNTKRKIRVEFERTDAWTRFKTKYLSAFFAKKAVWWIFRFILLLGISYVVLFPFFAKISNSFKSVQDFLDVTVNYIPKYPTLDTYRAIIVDQGYFDALWHTVLLSGVCALLQTFVCCIIGYGFAKFKFKGSNVVFALVLLTMIIPHQNLRHAMRVHFSTYDLFGILSEPINMIDTYWPLALLSATGLAFKNGLYIFMMRQFFRGVPDELEESAYIDGYGPFKTFVKIILPLSVPMMITIFLFSFSWQWTDNFYVKLFFNTAGSANGEGYSLLYNMVTSILPRSLQGNVEAAPEAVKILYQQALTGTQALMILLPLLIVFLFCQRYLVQGIERSGIVG